MLFFCLFVCSFFAPVCIVQAYRCLLVVSSLLTGRRHKSILMLFLENEEEISQKITEQCLSCQNNSVCQKLT